MSEPKGLFDAAIEVLNRHTGIYVLGAEEEACQSAIRVLEAAGKVEKRDKIRLAIWADFHERLCGKHGGSWLPDDDEAYDRICALLESLPDKAEDTFDYQSVFGSKPGKEE